LALLDTGERTLYLAGDETMRLLVEDHESALQALTRADCRVIARNALRKVAQPLRRMLFVLSFRISDGRTAPTDGRVACC
jgi:hypothetical protein